MNSRSTRSAPIRHVVALLMAVAIAPFAAAQSEEEGFVLRLDVVADYEDNVALQDASVTAPQRDYILRVVPSIEFNRTYGEHTYTLDANVELRNGASTSVSETNASLSAGVDLAFNGGLSLRPTYGFVLTNFDQALFVTDPSLAEPDVAKTLHNEVGVTGAYVPRRRLSLEGGYTYTRESFDFGSSGGEDRRDIQAGTAELKVPVTRSLVGYARGEITDQQADERTEFVFQRYRYAGGLRAEGNQLALYGEIGNGVVDYAETAGIEFDALVYRLGLELAFNEVSFVTAWAGRGAYGDLEAEAVLFAIFADGSNLTVQGRRSTENSFSRVLQSLLYESTLVATEWSKELLERWNISAGGTFFRLDSDTQRDNTSIGRVRVEYEWNSWLRIGAAYRHSRRSSSLPNNDFDDNRISAFFSLVRDR